MAREETEPTDESPERRQQIREREATQLSGGTSSEPRVTREQLEEIHERLSEMKSRRPD